MKVQLQLVQMAEDYINILGKKLAARQKFHTHVHSRDTMK